MQLLGAPGEHEKRFVLGPTARKIARIYAGRVSEAPEPPPANTGAGLLDAATLAHGDLPEGDENAQTPAAALVTAAAVATEAHEWRAVPKPREVRVAAVILGALGSAGLLFVATRDPHPKGEAAVASVSQAVAATTSPTLSPSTNPVSSAAPPLFPVSVLVAEPRLQPAPRTPSVHVSAPAAPRPPPRPFAPAGPVTAPPPAPAPNKPNCDPPYDFDVGGNKRWKRGCL